MLATCTGIGQISIRTHHLLHSRIMKPGRVLPGVLQRAIGDWAHSPEECLAAGGADGRAWLARLPLMIETLCRRWDLHLADDVDPRHGYHGLVLTVHHSGARYVLKLTWPPAKSVAEAHALATWNGEGAVHLVASNTPMGALLLEHLDPTRTLTSLPIAEAATIAGRLLRRLAVPVPEGFPNLRTIAGDIACSLAPRQERFGHPVPRHWLEEAQRLADAFARSAQRDVLVHADLHYGNVLAGGREPWLAIDPRPIAGEPEHAVPELLWARIDELRDAAEIQQLLATVVDAGMLDAETARKWVVVRGVDYWLWGLEHGLTEDPKRCARLLNAFVSPLS